MTIIQFTHYLHDGDYETLLESIYQSSGVELTEEQQQLMGRPFYTVKLDCELNLETGTVRIVQACRAD